jgi:hypothetical protein
MTDDGGVLGNLPNSRPGNRSEKRGGAASVKPRRTAAVKKPGSPDPVPPPPAEDPVGAVVRAGLGIAGTGARVAGAVGREVFRRLPRP